MSDVPWHRVVRSDGGITQGRKQLARLRKEGVKMRGNRVDLSAARLPRGITLDETSRCMSLSGAERKGAQTKGNRRQAIDVAPQTEFHRGNI